MPDQNVTNVFTLNDTAENLAELAYLHGTQLGLLGSISTGSGGNEPGMQTVDSVKRPWIDPPEGYSSFDAASSIALPAVGISGTIVSFLVPDGWDGVVNAFSWNFTGAGFNEGSGDLVVQILRNDAAVRNYDNITVSKGTIPIPRPISAIRIYSKQLVSIRITNVTGGLLTGNVVGSLVGYIYPSKG